MQDYALNENHFNKEADNFNFSKNEIKIIRLWADNVIHGGHWGDGDVVFPDEAITIEKLDKDKDISFNSRDLDIIKIWSDTSTDTPEEEILKNKINKYLGIQDDFSSNNSFPS